MRELGPAEVRALRAWAQGVGGERRAGSVAEVLERCLAVQAQDVRAAALGIRARAHGLTEADVYRALGGGPGVVRGWFMRGTLYLVPARDAGWLRELFAPLLLRRSERRYRELGLGTAELALGERVIAESLADGPLTRDELAARMTAAGLRADGQVPFHLVRRSALLGTACCGPVREDGSATYVLAENWLPEAAGPRGADAVRELLHRYLTAHGPATVADFATWSGLGLPAVRAAWKELLGAGLTEPCRVEGQDGYALAAGTPSGPEPTGDVRLLPAYDNYLVGFTDRRLSVELEHARRVWPGGGQISPTVVVDGLVRGVWRRDRTRGVDLEMFDPAGQRAADGADRRAPDTAGQRAPDAADQRDPDGAALRRRVLDAEVRDVARFLAG
ncbi:winged helix DNA-binding domain-containing protein [Streptomyces sp. NPDC093018]|uniref:winged helix DNA-binding domain-containing protein n=1 Tax=Streptomyces sp. NPDC093018 TaxID=3155067 RepID=UPI0034457115